jgi:hypothetical protein
MPKGYKPFGLPSWQEFWAFLLLCLGQAHQHLVGQLYLDQEVHLGSP